MATATAQAPEPHARLRARRTLTWFLLFAVAMFFAALFSAYVVSMGSTEYWVHFRLPSIFFISTALIVLGSVTAQWALVVARRGRSQQATLAIALTFGLGLAFSWTQFQGWSQLFDRGYAMLGRLSEVKGTYGEDFTISKANSLDGQRVSLVLEDGRYYRADDTARSKPLNNEMDEFKNTASSYFHVLTYSHFAHVLGGLIALLVMVFLAFRGRYTAEDQAGLWAGVMYWHFLAAVWVAILSFLAIVH